MKPTFLGSNCILPLLMAISFLVACGPSEKPKAAFPQKVKQFDQATVLQGLVIVKDKPIKSGWVKAYHGQDKLLVEVVLQDSNHYLLEIPAQTKLPVILRYFPELDSPLSEQLVVIVVEPSITQYDISSLTSAIAKKAEALGGYTRSNMILAAESMVNVPDSNKTSAGFRGDPTSQYGGWH
ncbi:MAG: hypothetical protein WC782_05240 [Methylococcaceae bacterium]|jgi:hypothetical protein